MHIEIHLKLCECLQRTRHRSDRTSWQRQVDSLWNSWSLTFRTPHLPLPKLWTSSCASVFLFLKGDRQNRVSFKLHVHQIHLWCQQYNSEQGKIFSLHLESFLFSVEDKTTICPLIHLFKNHLLNSARSPALEILRSLLPPSRSFPLSWRKACCVQKRERSLEDCNTVFVKDYPKPKQYPILNSIKTGPYWSLAWALNR